MFAEDTERTGSSVGIEYKEQDTKFGLKVTEALYAGAWEALPTAGSAAHTPLFPLCPLLTLATDRILC